MGIRNVTVREALAEQNDGATYVDVRSVPEFEQGHPAGAVNVPLMHRHPLTGQMTPNAEFVAVMSKAFPADTPLLLGCQAGMRSAHAAQVLAASGFSNLANVIGGYGGGPDPRRGGIAEGWVQAGLPVGRGADAGESYEAVRGRRGGEPRE